jgi:hypothetical protein
MPAFPSSFDEDQGDNSGIPTLVDEADLMIPPGNAPLHEGIAGEQMQVTMVEEPEETIDGLKPPLPMDTIALPTRPMLRRDGSAPAPAPRQPPPPTPPPQIPDMPGDPTDSLSLQQLKRLVAELPRVELTPYTFSYEDAASFPEELEEWFAYTHEEQARISKTQSSFAQEWGAFNNSTFFEGSVQENGAYDWANTSPARRKEFIIAQLNGLKETDLDKRLRHLESLVYIALGCWQETAGLEAAVETGDEGKGKRKVEETPDSPYNPYTTSKSNERDTYGKSGLQIHWIRMNTWTIMETQGIQPLLDIFGLACEREL